MNINFQQLINNFSNFFASPLFQLGKENVNLIWIFRLLLSFLIVAFITKVIKQFLKNKLLGKLGIDAGNREAIATLISYTLGTIGCIVAIQANGINLATFAVILGGLGIGIGLGFQDITKNLVSGLTLLIERKLKVGDFVEFENTSGYIEEISIRSAVVRTLDGNAVIIPNSKLVDNKVLNRSYKSGKKQVKIPISVAYDSDPILVTETLLSSAYMEGNILEEPQPKVIFIGFGDSALNFELWVWTDKIEKVITTKSSLNFIVEYNFRMAGIKIPFPQREIYVNNNQPSLSIPATRELSNSFFLKDFLKQITYFQSLNDLHLRSLIELGCRKHLEESEILYHQGDAANAFFIVLSGAIEAIYQQGDNEQHLFTFSTGQFFGELPLILGIPYPTTMRAASETILFMINRHSFGQLLHSYPGLAEEIAQEMAKRKETIEEHQKQLRELGLLEDLESEKNPVIWLRKRLKSFLSLT